MSISPRSRRRSARPSIAIRRRRSPATTRSSIRPSRRLPHLICYAVKANSNQAVLKTLAGSARAWMSCPRANFAARWRRAPRLKKSPFPASARRQAEMAFALDAGHSLLQCRIGAGTRAPYRNSPRPEPDRAHRPPGQSGRRCQNPCQDLDRQGGKQVRHPA